MTTLPHASPVVEEHQHDGQVFLAGPDGTEAFALTPAGLVAWRGLAAADSLEALCSRVHDAYPDVAPEVVRRDLLELLGALASRGYVVTPDA